MGRVGWLRSATWACWNGLGQFREQLGPNFGVIVVGMV